MLPMHVRQPRSITLEIELLQPPLPSSSSRVHSSLSLCPSRGRTALLTHVGRRSVTDVRKLKSGFDNPANPPYLDCTWPLSGKVLWALFGGQTRAGFRLHTGIYVAHFWQAREDCYVALSWLLFGKPRNLECGPLLALTWQALYFAYMALIWHANKFILGCVNL